MAVAKVTFMVLLFSITAFFSLRFYGLHQNYSRYDHPLLNQETTWAIAWGGDQSQYPSHSQSALQKAALLSDVILGVQIQLNADHHFYVVPAIREFKVDGILRKLSDLTDREVQEIDLGDGHGPYSLEVFLKNFGSKPLFLWVADNVEGVDLRLHQVLKNHSNLTGLFIHSEYDNVLKSLKALMPQILYGTGVGQRVRLIMLASVGLESLATIDGDFLVSPIKDRGVKVITQDLIKELRRRQKLFIIGPLESLEANTTALSYGGSGYLSGQPQHLKNMLVPSSSRVDLSVPTR